MPLPRATSCFLRPSSPLPFHAQVSHSFPTDPFVSSAAGVCFGRYRPRGPRPLFIARCRRPSDFDAASTILEAGIETSNCCWNRRRARCRFSWARLKSWLGKSSPDALCTGTVAATSAGAGAGSCGGDHVTHARSVHIRRALGMGVQNLRQRRMWTVALLLVQ